MKPKTSWYIYRHKRRSIFAIILLILISMFLFQNATFEIRTLTAIAFLLAFYSVDHFFDLKFKHFHYGIILLIAIFTLLLSPLYFVYPQYDKMQHFVIPILLSFLVFHMMTKQKLELKWKIAFTAITVLSILTIHEIMEYSLDLLFELKLQGVFLRDLAGLQKLNIIQNQIDDTMIDLIWGLAGAMTYGIMHLKFFNKN